MKDKEEIIRALKLIDGESLNIPIFRFHMVVDNIMIHKAEVDLGTYHLLYEFTSLVGNSFLCDVHTILDLVEILETMPPEDYNLEIYEIEEYRRNYEFVEDIIIEQNNDLSDLL